MLLYKLYPSTLIVAILALLFVPYGVADENVGQSSLNPIAKFQKIIDTVITPPDGQVVYPQPPKIRFDMKIKVMEELHGHEELIEAYKKLGVSNSNHDWFEGINVLKEAHAVWALSTGLIHPHDDVKIKAAEALGEIGDIKDKKLIMFMIDVAKANAVHKQGSEEATLHGLFQHAITDTLNQVTHADVKLKLGQDPDGLYEGIDKWKARLNKKNSIVGTKAREWQASTWLNSKKLKLEDLEGKVVLVRWWTAPDCVYCENTAPALNDFYKNYRKLGFVVVGFYHHKSFSLINKRKIEYYADQLGFKFPVAIDDNWKTLKDWWLKDKSHLFTSISFLIDRTGVIRYVHPGGEFIKGDEEYQKIQEMIESLLAE